MFDVNVQSSIFQFEDTPDKNKRNMSTWAELHGRIQSSSEHIAAASCVETLSAER